MKTNRQLAAIMFTDIVGYTAMMQENEKVAAAVRLRHREVFQEEHQQCNGEILQYYGDGTLSIFKSAVEAVECAIAMQLQFRIGQEVPLRIGIHLGEAEHQEKLVVAPTMNMETYETYLRGLYYSNQFGNDKAMAKAIPFFEKAIEMQPDFGLPHAKLGICYLFQAWGTVLTWEEAHKKAMLHIERTNELGAETAESNFARAVFEIFFKWDWAGAVAAIKKGLELFPNYASLYHALSTMYYISGDLDTVIKIHVKGLELDPMSLEMIFFMGIAYLWNEEYDKALPYLQKVTEIAPNHRTAWECIGWTAAFQGQYDKAIAIFEKMEPALGFRLHRATCLGWVYFKMGETANAKACLQEIIELEKQAVGHSIDLMTLYSGFGDFDRAFHYLEKAIRNKVGDSMMFRTDVYLIPLREDPRWKDMEALVGEVPEIDF